MKIFKAALTVLFMSLMAACSSDDAATPVNTTPEGPEATYFNYKLNGQTVPIVAYNGLKNGNELRVTGGAADGSLFIITFTASGQLAEVGAIPAGTAAPKWNYKNFRKNYFDFELVHIANGQAKVNFSGKVYENDYDLDSEFSTVEGSFVVDLQEEAATAPMFKMDAMVNGNSWKALGGTEHFSAFNYSIDYLSDDEYEISLVFHPANLEIGNYTFTETTGDRRIMMTKYNTATHNEDELISTAGNFNVTSKTEFGPIDVIEGTFDVVAKHPETNEIVTVTNGTFRATYQY